VCFGGPCIAVLYSAPQSAGATSNILKEVVAVGHRCVLTQCQHSVCIADSSSKVLKQGQETVNTVCGEQVLRSKRHV
jgi:hypothetical protein